MTWVVRCPSFFDCETAGGMCDLVEEAKIALRWLFRMIGPTYLNDALN